MNTIRAQERDRWKSMLWRTEDPRCPTWKHYGGRGITVCQQWHDFETYFADIMRLLGPCPEGMSIDRIDNDGGYGPANVRWATRSQQQANTRNGGSNFMLTATQVREELGISRDTLLKLIKDGEFPGAMKASPNPLGHWRIPAEDLDDYKRRNAVTPRPVAS